MDFDSEEDNAEHNVIRSVLINRQTSAKEVLILTKKNYSKNENSPFLFILNLRDLDLEQQKASKQWQNLHFWVELLICESQMTFDIIYNVTALISCRALSQGYLISLLIITSFGC